MPAANVHRTIDAVWRIESPRLIAALTRIVRDVGLAEELAHDALVIALEKWPGDGIPENPGAWLMATAKHRAIDSVRHRKLVARKRDEIARESPSASPTSRSVRDAAREIDAALDDEIGDDLLRLVFMTCHPALSTEARAALTLRLLGGLTVEEIARAFLTTPATISQRIVRAKKTLRDPPSPHQVDFEAPRGEELAARLPAVLEVVYLIFNEGYTATAGDDWMRPTLCEEALRLGRILAELAPAEPEVHGLVALMEIQHSRARARLGANGEPILLLEQNRARWDHLLIRRGLAALERAEATARSAPQADGASAAGEGRGGYTLQAAIAACHARARTAAATDWVRIAGLYAQLAAGSPSPIVELNRAVATAMAFGPQAGLALVDTLAGEPALRSYHLLPTVRGDLLFKLGRFEEARAEFQRAAQMTSNARERALLEDRAKACRRGGEGAGRVGEA